MSQSVTNGRNKNVVLYSGRDTYFLPAILNNNYLCLVEICCNLRSKVLFNCKKRGVQLILAMPIFKLLYLRENLVKYKLIGYQDSYNSYSWHSYNDADKPVNPNCKERKNRYTRLENLAWYHTVFYQFSFSTQFGFM